jgi:hypothetical protein
MKNIKSSIDFSTVHATLAKYRAELDEDFRICREGKKLGVTVEIKKGRLRFISFHDKSLIFSGPINSESIHAFVQKFWYWSPVC